MIRSIRKKKDLRNVQELGELLVEKRKKEVEKENEDAKEAMKIMFLHDGCVLSV